MAEAFEVEHSHPDGQAMGLPVPGSEDGNPPGHWKAYWVEVDERCGIVPALDYGGLRFADLRSMASRTAVHAMRMFLVTFHKTVSDGRGHDHRVLQQQTVVPASYGEAAADAAKALFCQAASIVDWRLRADTCEVVELADLAV